MKMPLVRRRYTVTEKIEVIGWHRRNGCNFSKTEREFSISRKQIRTWEKEYEKLVKFSGSATDKARKSLGPGGAPKSNELDRTVYDWFEEERVHGRVVTNFNLQGKAREIASQLRVTNFVASNGWLRRWKTRFSVGLRRGTNDAQKVPADYKEKITAFHDSINSLRRRWDYTDFNIANMDQTMVRFDSVPNFTNELKGAKTVRISHTGGNKKGCTVALSATASGHKLPAFIIFKERNGVIPPKVAAELAVPPNVRVSASLNGWMTMEKMHEWIRRVWGPNCDDVRRVLILDSYRPHTAPATSARFEPLETDVVTVPGGCTGLVQPMDTHVNKVFKERLRRSWVEWFQTAKKNVRGNYIQPSRQNVVSWISRAWTYVTEETIQNSFKSCGISLALDGSDGHLLSSRLKRDVGITPLDELEELETEMAAGVRFDDESDEEDDYIFLGWDDDNLSVYGE